MLKAISLSIVLANLLFAANIFGQLKPFHNGVSAAGLFPVSELREGMRGTAKTVFSGNKSEEFTVEILGVIPDWVGPKQDMIIGRLSGANAERTFVFAGMSGSPVYIDGKLVGAIAYSFPFAKEPICGITPFSQMVSLVEMAGSLKPPPAGQRVFSLAELGSDDFSAWALLTGIGRKSLATGIISDPRLTAVAGQTLMPISTPLMISGVAQQTIDSLTPLFSRAGLMPIPASGGRSDKTKFKEANENTLLGGDSIIVHLARGDIQLSAAGTVTVRDGNKIYAFGHPFFGLGSTSLPMSESSVVTVVPNANNSFKLSVPEALVGTMTQDRATGIYGLLGTPPKMLPVKLTLNTSRNKREIVEFESAFDEFLTPLIVNAGVGNSIVSNERGLGLSTIVVSGEITVKGESPIRIDRRFTGAQAAGFAAAAAAIPLGNLLRADFQGLEITGLNLTMTITEGSQTAVLERIAIDRSQARPGDTVEITAFNRSASGKVYPQTFSILIPTDTPEGPLTITVGDGNAVMRNSAITQFAPATASEMINVMNQLKRPDRLYAVVSRTSAGAIVGASEMPNLPPSFIATINNDRTAGGGKPTVNTVVAEIELPASEHIVTGSQTLTIEVIR